MTTNSSHADDFLRWARSWLRACPSVLARASRWLAPDYCAACDEPLAGGAVFCAGCGACPEPPGVVDAWRVAGAYAPPLSTAILRMKFGQRADVAGRLVTLLEAPCGSLDASVLVAPVPLHPQRLVERGYNPAALLARGLSRSAGARFAPHLLVRQRDTPKQSLLSAGERRDNVAGAFRASFAARGARVVLVDDVVTTGSTVGECARALYAAGVVHVTVLALAAAAPP